MKNNQIQSAFFDFNSECTLQTMNKRIYLLQVALHQYCDTTILSDSRYIYFRYYDHFKTKTDTDMYQRLWEKFIN